MNLALYAESLREQLNAAAELSGAENRALVDRLSVAVEAATRLVLLEAISAAADEITSELAPGAVEVRLRGSDPEFVVRLPSDATRDVAGPSTPHGFVSESGEEGGTSRLNLRLPESLKVRIEEAARREGLSLNTWLVRIAAAAVEGSPAQVTRSSSGSERYTGWVR
jgi:hypothetical protein